MFAVLRLAHSVFNRTNNNDGISANLVDGEMRGVVGLLACLAMTVAVRLLYRRRMTREFARQLNP